jgi:hypothetical protein
VQAGTRTKYCCNWFRDEDELRDADRVLLWRPKKATTLSEQLPDPIGSNSRLSLLNLALSFSRLFMFALIHIANCRYDKQQPRKYLTSAREYVSELRGLVKKGSVNFVHKLQICDAELASLDDSLDADKIRQKYQIGIASAARAGYIQDAAVASYLLSQFCEHRSKLNVFAALHLVKSYELYMTWGATAVAESLKARHPIYFDSSSYLDDSGSGTHLQSRSRFNKCISETHKSKDRDHML